MYLIQIIKCICFFSFEDFIDEAADEAAAAGNAKEDDKKNNSPERETNRDGSADISIKVESQMLATALAPDRRDIPSKPESGGGELEFLVLAHKVYVKPAVSVASAKKTLVVAPHFPVVPFVTQVGFEREGCKFRRRLCRLVACIGTGSDQSTPNNLFAKRAFATFWLFSK